MTTPGDFEIARSVLTGYTADNELHRALTILRNEGINPEVVVEFTAEREGIFCGITEVKTLLGRVLPETGREVWALDEGVGVVGGEVALRIRAPYASFGLFETAILGTLASCTGWATAAAECVEAGDGIPIIGYGARHVHPGVVGVMDYAAVMGGCASSSSVVGQQLHGLTPSGTMPHSLVLLMGDTVRSMMAFDKHMPPEVPRVALVDTFKDEIQEALEVANINRSKHGVSVQVHLHHGDLIDALPCDMDIIVSNPPYIRSGEVTQLAEEVRREPAVALDGGADGLRLIRRLFQQAPARLRPGGGLVVEISPEQLESVSELARDAVPGGRVSFRRDLLGLPRAVVLSLS
ncbi:MAG: methyltransferase [Chloroflexi bacterium]|nr:methyltransferase [Chloroflexota bacterium]